MKPIEKKIEEILLLGLNYSQRRLSTAENIIIKKQRAKLLALIRLEIEKCLPKEEELGMVKNLDKFSISKSDRNFLKARNYNIVSSIRSALKKKGLI